MSKYTAKTALIDLGFIDGYLHETGGPIRDWTWFDVMHDALERIEQYVKQGYLEGSSPTATSYACFLHDLGFLRGLLWSHPISSALSAAIGRVIAFATDNDQCPFQLLDGCGETAEPADIRLSDEQRHVTGEAVDAGEDTTTADFASSIGATRHGVLEHWRKQGALSCEDVEQQLKADEAQQNEAVEAPILAAKKEWHLLVDDRADEVRRMAQTMTDDEMADELGVSRDTVLRFRKKHGIEKAHGPRDGKSGRDRNWEPWQKQTLIEMKQEGHSYGEISRVVGKTPNQCSGMWFWEKKKLDAATTIPELPTPGEAHALLH